MHDEIDVTPMLPSCCLMRCVISPQPQTTGCCSVCAVCTAQNSECISTETVGQTPSLFGPQCGSGTTRLCTGILLCANCSAGSESSQPLKQQVTSFVHLSDLARLRCGSSSADIK